MKQITTLHPENNQDIELYPNILPDYNIPDKSIGSDKLKDELIAMITGATQEQVNEWLDNHPEATTSVEDGSLGEIKFTQEVIDNFKNRVKIGNVKDYGAVGDGVTIDNNAIRNAINDNDFIYFPKGKYLLTDYITISNKYIFGEFSIKYNDTDVDYGIYITGSNGLHLVNCICTNIRFIGDLTINNKAINGLTTCIIDNCSFYNFDIAIYDIKTSEIINSRFNGNNWAISGSVDSRIINNFFNSNSKAINLYQGSNDNIITNNKIEWSTDIGIDMYICTSNVISNNIFDRQTHQGLRVSGSSKCVISSNMFRRNYVGVTSDTNVTHNQIYIESSSYLTLSGNITRVGNSMDDGTGWLCPSTPIYIYNSNNIVFVGNDFTGGTYKQKAETYQNTNLKFYNIEDYQNLPYLTYNNNSEIFVSANSTQTFTFDVSMSDTKGNYYKFDISARTTNKSSFVFKSIVITTFNVWGSSPTISIDNNTITTNLTLSVSYSDGQATITITNNTTATWGIIFDQIVTKNLIY